MAAGCVTAADWVPAYEDVCRASTACVAIFGGAKENEWAQTAKGKQNPSYWQNNNNLHSSACRLF
jgi:hypothetical protein